MKSHRDEDVCEELGLAAAESPMKFTLESILEILSVVQIDPTGTTAGGPCTSAASA